MPAELSEQFISTLLADSGLQYLIYINCGLLIVSLAVAYLSVRFHSQVVDKFLIREDDIRNSFKTFVDGVNAHLCTLSRGIEQILNEHRDRKHENERIVDLVTKK